MKPIVFFDINGTLIERDQRTDLPFIKAVDELLGMKNTMKGIDTAARSDQDVFREALSKSGVTYTEKLWLKFLTLYETHLNQYAQDDIWRPNVDAVEFVERLSKFNVTLALITGELSMGAAYKLKKIGLWSYFFTGGFGEDGLTRFEIADAALEKVKKQTDEKIQSIWVIGDTVLDIKTARHLGAKVISIDTGANTEAELKAMYPDQLIHKFSEIELKTLIHDR